MESTREPRRSFVGPIVVGLIIAVIAVWVTVATVTSRDPEDTVEAYLSAIVEKDVDGALELVTRYGSGVPYGATAAFLTPEAISDDWWVVSVAEIDREYGTARVKAVIGGPGGTAEGEFVVEEDDDEWLLSDPFVQVGFPVSPLSYIQVNDKIVPRSPDENGFETYSLFPGTYRFYQSVPDVVATPETEVVAAFPQEDSDERSIVPRALTAGQDTLAQLQKAVKQHIDECAGFATPAPYGDCPFATDGEIDTADGKRVTELHGLTWKVASYPVAALADNRVEYSPGFALRADKPGAVTLSGSGVDTDDKPTTFTVTCEVSLSGLTATIGVDGKVDLAGSPASTTDSGTFNTCRRNT